MTESLVFPVALEAPEPVQVAGRRWFRRPEFHVTTFDPGGDRRRYSGPCAPCEGAPL